MPTVKIISNKNLGTITPDVFIDSVHIYNAKNKTLIKVFFKLIDEQDLWIKNKNILNELYIFLYINNVLILKRGLSSLKKSEKLNELSGEFITEINDASIALEAYTGNDTIRGNSTLESVLSGGELVASTFENIKYQYINKNKDLRLLDFNNFLNFKANVSNNQIFLSKKAYISYNVQKKAAIGYLFDLEKCLEKNSPAYNILKNSSKIKENILKNCKILDDTCFYKKNIDSADQEFEKIQGSLSIKKISTSNLDQRYLISVVDEQNKNFNFSRYKLKIKISFLDATYKLIKQDFLNNIFKIKNFILKYKNSLNLLQSNKLVEDYKTYFYNNEYKNVYKSNTTDEAEIFTSIKNLANVFATTTNISIDKYYGLLASIFNPLTYNPECIDLLLSSIDTLENYYRTLFYSITENISDDIQSKKENLIFSTELLEELDYNYNHLYGFDVLSQQPYSNKTTEPAIFPIISPEEKISRKALESRKFLDSEADSVISSLQYFSISNIFLGDEALDLLNIDSPLELNTFNKNFVTLNQFNQNKNFYNLEESVVNDLGLNGVYVKSIGHGKNTSKSKLFKDLLFDNNDESKISSNQKIKSFKVENLYLFMTKYKFNIPEFLQKQYLLNQRSGINYKRYAISSSSGTVRLDPFKPEKHNTKSVAIMLFNNFFKDVKVTAGEGNVYDIYELTPNFVNDIFTEKLKFFNQYYIIQNMDVVETTEEESEYPFKAELINYNILPIYVNRTVNKFTNDLTLSEI